MNRFLPKDKAADLLRTIASSSIRSEYDPEKHRLTLLDEAGNEQVYFRLPLTLPYPGIAKEKPVGYVILLIQSGNCAMGYFENGRCLDHKVYRAYMVRKKQGKSQIKYLKTKGKSRAGSRVRLGETLEFFENINGRLQVYFKEHEVQRIAISCSKTLLPYLYSSKVSTPFDKHDPRLFKIPKHIHTPIYEVLLDTNRFLQRGELTDLTGSGFTAIPILYEFLEQHQSAGSVVEDQADAYTLEDEVFVDDDREEDFNEYDPDDEENDAIEDW